MYETWQDGTVIPWGELLARDPQDAYNQGWEIILRHFTTAVERTEGSTS